MSNTAASGVQTAGRLPLAGFAARTHAAIEAFLHAERQQLLLWAPVGLGAGVAAWFLLPTPGAWAAFAALSLALAVAGAVTSGWTGRVLLAGGLLMALGLGLAWARADSVAAPRLAGERFAATFSAEVLEVEDRSGRDQWRLFLRPQAPGLPPKVRVSLRDPPPSGVTAGAVVELRATLRPPPGPSVPGGYDFARKAWFEGIGAVGYALGPIRLVARAPPPGGPVAWLERKRVELTKLMQQGVGGASGGIAAALITGDQGGIPEPTAQAMRDSGLAHLLSISGLHIAVVVGGVMVATRRLLALSPRLALHLPLKTVAAALAAVAGVAYTLLAGSEVPTVRSMIAAIFVLIGIVAGRQALSLRTVAVGAFLILLIRPEALLGPSFQLSFAAVTGLIAAYQSKAGRRLFEAREDEGFIRGSGRWVLGLIVSGLIAEAMLSPTALFHFNKAGIYGAVANLVAIPLTSFVVMPLLGLTLLLDAFGLAQPAFWALRQTLDLLIAVAHTVASWPGAVMQAPTMPLGAYGLFVLGGLWLCLWEGRERLAGFVPVAAGALIAILSRPPDLIVSGDGKHLGLVRQEDGALALLRPRAGRFIREMWGDAAGAQSTLPIDEVADTACSPDACIIQITRDGRQWRILATRSRHLIPRPDFQPACAAADIIVSDRRLPRWCQPRWLKLDRATLGRTGSLAIDFDGPSVTTSADRHGAHPWRPEPPAFRPSWGRAPSS